MITSIETIPVHCVMKLAGVFFDIDDTLTTRGKILAPAFSALWTLQEKGLRVVAITGTGMIPKRRGSGNGFSIPMTSVRKNGGG